MFNSRTLYCDGAGGKDHGFIVVAGYLSTFARWQSFVGQWNYMLASYGVPYFHMKEFSQSKGVFSAWKGDESLRASFLASAAEVIRQNVEAGFASIVEFSPYEKINTNYMLREAVGPPYSLAARTCVAKTILRLERNRLPEDNVTYVFEDGDEGKGELLRVMEKDGYPLPIFRPSRDKNDKTGKRVAKGVVPLQAADFAAYEVRKVFRDDPLEEWPVWKYRKSLAALARIESDWGRYQTKDLVKMCEVGSVWKRSIIQP